MSDYRRWFVAGGTYFLTLVTYNRQPILTVEHSRLWLREAILKVHQRHPFRILATVLLPDHWHLIIQLPPSDDRYSRRLQLIKAGFSRRYLLGGMAEANVSSSQSRRGERGIWQPRFWEHTIADEEDLNRCADYIHWNPRKHDLVQCVQDWPWSSFHRFVEEGHYEANWGGEAPKCVTDQSDWGEPGSAK